MNATRKLNETVSRLWSALKQSALAQSARSEGPILRTGAGLRCLIPAVVFASLLLPPLRASAADVDYEYNVHGRLTRVTYNDTGKVITITYDDAGNRIIRTITSGTDNSDPIAYPDLASIPVFSFSGSSPLVNDTDPDGDPLTITSAQSTNPAQVFASVGCSNTCVKLVAYADVRNFYVFYDISDGNGGTDTGFILVTSYRER